jgi:NAD(P)-dependent dehydrogenase (short-subunit alcohol dehydrogenase family)
LEGKVAIITGGNAGIGLVSATELAKRGAHVILACRNSERGADAVSHIQKMMKRLGRKGTAQFLQLDTSKSESISEFSTAFLALQKPLHYLVCNAGTAIPPKQSEPTKTCIIFQTNYLGHFQLVNLLLPKIMDTASSGHDCRIVHVSSGAHFRASINFDDVARPDQIPGNSRYGQSKLAQVILPFARSRRRPPIPGCAVAHKKHRSSRARLNSVFVCRDPA